MPGFEPAFLRRLSNVLRQCGPFDTQEELQTFFSLCRTLEPWANELPNSANPRQRVRSVIKFLHNRHNTRQENALLLFVEALKEDCVPQDACRSRLEDLLKDLRLYFNLPNRRDSIIAKKGQELWGRILHSIPNPEHWKEITRDYWLSEQFTISLDNEELYFSARAVSELRTPRDSQIYEDVIDLLRRLAYMNDPNAFVALSWFDDDMRVGSLLRSLANDYISPDVTDRVRYRAASALRKLSSKTVDFFGEAVSLLLEIADRSQDGEMLYEIAIRLKEWHREEESESILVEIANNSLYADIRHKVARALAKYDNDRTRLYAANIFKDLGEIDEAIAVYENLLDNISYEESLLYKEGLLDETSRISVDVINIADNLEGLGKPSGWISLALNPNLNEEIRSKAVLELGSFSKYGLEYQDRIIIDCCRTVAQDTQSSTQLRKTAIESVENIASDVALELWVDIYMDETITDSQFRIDATGILIEKGAVKQAVEGWLYLVQTLPAENYDLRRQAAEELEKYDNNPDGWFVLVRDIHLESQDRFDAAEAITRFDGNAAGWFILIQDNQLATPERFKAVQSLKEVEDNNKGWHILRKDFDTDDWLAVVRDDDLTPQERLRAADEAAKKGCIEGWAILVVEDFGKENEKLEEKVPIWAAQRLENYIVSMVLGIPQLNGWLREVRNTQLSIQKRFKSAEATARHGYFESWAILVKDIELAGDKRYEAAQKLENRMWYVLAKDENVDSMTRHIVAKTLAQLGQDDYAIEIWSALYTSPSTDDEIRPEIRLKLAKALLRLAWNDKSDIGTRCKAIEYLGSFGSEDTFVVDGLLSLVRTPEISPLVQSKAEEVLRNQQHDR